TLRSESYGLPEEKVDEHKQNQLYKIAEAYLAENALEDMNCRFDIISIMIKNNTFNINHIEDAFQL
ncbi:MAG TPA: YraN family protein, partial [Bacteroidales bacterium]|nr:YraN family protein [Bacteroidales bacterium]